MIPRSVRRLFWCKITRRHRWFDVPDGGNFRSCALCGEPGWLV